MPSKFTKLGQKIADAVAEDNRIFKHCRTIFNNPHYIRRSKFEMCATFGMTYKERQEVLDQAWGELSKHIVVTKISE